MKIYYDKDADLNIIKSKKIAIVGYGSQAHAHAQNLRDSGVNDVKIALKEGSQSIAKAQNAGFDVLTNANAAKWADLVMVLAPDEFQSDIYEDNLKDNLKKGATLAFAHGLNVHFNLIKSRSDLDVIMFHLPIFIMYNITILVTVMILMMTFFYNRMGMLYLSFCSSFLCFLC